MFAIPCQDSNSGQDPDHDLTIISNTWRIRPLGCWTRFAYIVLPYKWIKHQLDHFHKREKSTSTEKPFKYDIGKIVKSLQNHCKLNRLSISFQKSNNDICQRNKTCFKDCCSTQLFPFIEELRKSRTKIVLYNVSSDLRSIH